MPAVGQSGHGVLQRLLLAPSRLLLHRVRALPFLSGAAAQECPRLQPVGSSAVGPVRCSLPSALAPPTPAASPGGLAHFLLGRSGHLALSGRAELRLHGSAAHGRHPIARSSPLACAVWRDPPSSGLDGGLGWAETVNPGAPLQRVGHVSRGCSLPGTWREPGHAAHEAPPWPPQFAAWHPCRSRLLAAAAVERAVGLPPRGRLA